MIKIEVPAKVKPKKIKPKELTTDLAKSLVELGFVPLSSDESPLRVRRCMPTGIPILDIICCRDVNGVYGLPFGKQIEVAGKYDAGKTSLLLQFAAAAQQQNHQVSWDEAEHMLDADRAKNIGADLDKFLCDTPDYLEQMLKRIAQAVMLLPESTGDRRTTGLLHCVDSLAAIPTKYEYLGKDENKDQNKPGDFAQKMAIFQRKFIKRLHSRDAIVVYANQLKSKIGVTMGRQTQSFGGNAIKYHCAVRLESTYTGRLLDSNGDVIGIKIKIDVIKNKYGIPFKKVLDLPFKFEGGFDYALSLLWALEAKGLAVREANSYQINPIVSGKSKYTAKAFAELIEKEPDVAKQLMNVIYNV